METPEAVLTEYVSHLPTRTQSETRAETYIDAAVARHGVSELVAAVVRATESLDPELTRGAWLFIRDAAIHGSSVREVSDAVRRELPGSGFFDALEHCLQASAFAVRSGAVYTFGKLGFPENADRLVRALKARRDIDPFLLPGLLLESRWLEGRWDAHWERVRELIRSPQELSRWASLEVMSEARDEQAPDKALVLAGSLEHDPSELIRAEAVYVVALMTDGARSSRSGRVSNEDWARSGREIARQERQRIAALRPRVTFHDLTQRFTWTLADPDYRLQDVIAFLEPLRS